MDLDGRGIFEGTKTWSTPRRRTGDNNMIEIEEMRTNEIEELLKTVGYGHLATARNNQPYVVPVHYAYDKPLIYVYTTEGKKSEIIKVNPQVCLQVEDVKSNQDWKSVIALGDAEQVSDPAERERALKLVAEVNPTLSPAVSIRWMDSWVRENIEVILKITPRMLTGRATIAKSDTDAPLAAGERSRSSIY